MNILEEIIEKKKTEVAQRKGDKSIRELERQPLFGKKTLSFPEFLLRKDKTGIIAEFKRKSPSKGVINDTSTVSEVISAYTQFGASAVSVLTDELFFGGSVKDLMESSQLAIPVLRKDFIIDEYQIIESKACGADIILLIAACLSTEEVKTLSALAKNAGLNVLLEIHCQEELGHICDTVDVVGINNRNLKTFRVDIDHSIRLCKEIPEDIIKISESGLGDTATIRLLRENGFSGFLMGERFMKEADPGGAFRDFVELMKTS